jgi:hypothetical protein
MYPGMNTARDLLEQTSAVIKHTIVLSDGQSTPADHEGLVVEMADAGTEGAAYAVRGFKQALILLQSEEAGGEAFLSRLLPILQDAKPDLIQASAELERVVTARQEIGDVEALPWRVRTLLSMMDEKLYLAQEFKLLPVLPQLLAHEGRRTYLIMAQNEDEIRPTGGFITGAGLLTVEDGQILDLTFQDANVVDDWRNKPYDAPPEPLTQLMGLDLFLFRDANFWPDFPTSAERAMQLYSYGQNAAPLDGVIAIDQTFVAMMVGVTGPISIPDLEMTVNRQNTIASLREAWGSDEEEAVQDWVATRKDFLGPLAQAMRVELLSNLRALDPLFLADTIHRAAAEKHLQIYVRDPQVAAVLHEVGWDGSIEAPASGDFLMVVDTNVGYNKVNPLIEQAITYDVQLAEDGTGTAALALRYRHTGDERDEPCSQDVSYGAGITYEALMQRCFWNYLRLYTPAGSRLLEGSEHRRPPGTFAFGEGWSGQAQTVENEAGLATFANFFVLPPGQSLTSSYRYALPQIATGETEKEYRLQVYKQAGQRPQPLEIQVTLPSRATLLETNPAATTVEGQTILFQTDLASNRRYTVSYR